MEKIDIGWWIIFFLFVLVLPYFPTVLFVSLDKSVNPTFISGFITASGVFLSLLTAAIINKSEMLDYNLKLAIYLDFILFAVALFKIFGSVSSHNDSSVGDLMTIMSSLMADIATAIKIVQKLRFQ